MIAHSGRCCPRTGGSTSQYSRTTCCPGGRRRCWAPVSCRRGGTGGHDHTVLVRCRAGDLRLHAFTAGHRQRLLHAPHLPPDSIGRRNPCGRRAPKSSVPLLPPNGRVHHRGTSRAGQGVMNALDDGAPSIAYSSTCLTKRSTWIGRSKHWQTRAGAAWWNGSRRDLPRSAN